MSEQRETGTELVRRVTHLNEVLEENDRLREAIRRLADQDATLSVQGGNVIVTMDATLTDAERSAIKEASEFYIGTRTGVALSGLLERLK